MKKIAICIILAAVIVIAAVCVGFLLIRADNEKSGDPLTYALEAYSPIYTENGLLLELSEDGSFYSVVGQGKCTDEHIVIPSAYNKKPIKAIKLCLQVFRICVSSTCMLPVHIVELDLHEVPMIFLVHLHECIETVLVSME